MSNYKSLTLGDIQTARSNLNQLIEIAAEDISSSVSRKTYEHFVTGGAVSGMPGVTSSLFHTIHDQDFSLQTSNAIFDMTIGLYPSGSVLTGAQAGTDQNNKRIFPSHSLNMREKGNNYRQFAQLLLGNADDSFKAPFNSTDEDDRIEEALFINIKRLFHRDQIKRGSLTLLMYGSASKASEDDLGSASHSPGSMEGGALAGFHTASLNSSDPETIHTWTDIGSDVNKIVTHGGGVAEIRSGSSGNKVGLSFIDQGILVLDMNKVFFQFETFTGSIDATEGTVSSVKGLTHFTGSFKDLLVSGSIDDIVSHIASTRFGGDTSTRVSFQNITNINSTLFFCRANANEFNYSSNPTYTNTDNEIVVIEEGAEDTQRSFTFVTSIGLYNSANNLLAVAKLSRPVEKNNTKDITFRIRLDF